MVSYWTSTEIVIFFHNLIQIHINEVVTVPLLDYLNLQLKKRFDSVSVIV